MTVSEEDVARVAELANLELTGEETAHMVHDLNSILDHVAQLNELDTAATPPMAQVGEQLAQRKGSSAQELRADVVSPSLSRDRVLACAPDTDLVFFRVPKVIER